MKPLALAFTFASLALSLILAGPAPGQEPPAPAAPTELAPIHDPFFGEGTDYERQARRAAAQAALNRCRILARGASGQSSAVLIALEEGRHSLLRAGDLLTLESEGELIDFELVSVTRQAVRFQLEDGSQLLLR